MLSVLFEALLKRGLISSDACIRELSTWVKDGTLSAEFTRDPLATTAVIVHTIATLTLAACSKFHDHSDEHLPSPQFGVMSTGPDNAKSVVTTSQVVNEIKSLGDVLGVQQPIGGLIEGPFVNLILQQLIAYLAANLPELIEQLLDKLRNQPETPVVGE